MEWGGHLFEAGRLLTFSAFRMGAYSRWALIRGWALIRINTVLVNKKQVNFDFMLTEGAENEMLVLPPHG